MGLERRSCRGVVLIGWDLEKDSDISREAEERKAIEYVFDYLLRQFRANLMY